MVEDIPKFCYSSITVRILSDNINNIPIDLYSRNLLVKSNKFTFDIYKPPCLFKPILSHSSTFISSIKPSLLQKNKTRNSKTAFIMLSCTLRVSPLLELHSSHFHFFSPKLQSQEIKQNIYFLDEIKGKSIICPQFTTFMFLLCAKY